jgi:Holliday junction resolvase RusA-like endonuclease
VSEVGAGVSRREVRLVLDGFPQPAVARSLSPNGRAHWKARQTARHAVEWAVFQAAGQNSMPGLRSPVRLSATFVLPIQRKRDDDNYATGVLKVVRDSLVRLGVLVADDIAHLRQAPVAIEVRKGQRRLEITLEEVD